MKNLCSDIYYDKELFLEGPESHQGQQNISKSYGWLMMKLGVHITYINEK